LIVASDEVQEPSFQSQDALAQRFILGFVDFDGWQYGLLLIDLFVNNFIFSLPQTPPAGGAFNQGVLIGKQK
jgi:hypothetical protein